MEIVNKIIIPLLWSIYCYFEGQREAYYYQLEKESNLKRKNIHYMYLIQRGIALVLIGALTKSIILPFSLACILPFIHDGVYYVTYNKLDPGVYPKGFSSSSGTSKAFMEFNWTKRLILLAMGIMLYAIDIVLLYYCSL